MLENDGGLGPRGGAIYQSLFVAARPDPAHDALIVEAARMADRLDGLNDIIASKGLVNLLHVRVPEHMNSDGLLTVVITVDSVLSEARQLQLAFERIVKTVTAGIEAVAEDGDEADEIAARRAARIAGAAG